MVYAKSQTNVTSSKKICNLISREVEAHQNDKNHKILSLPQMYNSKKIKMIFRSLLKIRGKKFSQQFLNADHVLGLCMKVCD